jgi:tetratricopeptide (TPR) repeat protein
MLGKKNQSAVLAKYFSMYKKNPRSKVFAPLAESFRKLGLLDDAFKILKDGIRYHPNYTLGYIVLAHCYFDQGKFELTYNTLRPIISQNADNISLQKIFAQACMNLGYLDEALDIYKYLLFMNPRDKFFIDQVKKLEDDLQVGHKKLSLDQLMKAPDLEKIPASTTLDDDWVQVDFNRPLDSVPQVLPDKKIEINEAEWVMQKPSMNLHPILKEEEIKTRDLEDDFFADEFEELGSVEEIGPHTQSEAPIVSHTLIDLYIGQKYFDKALELVDKILELNPKDKPSHEKRGVILKLMSESQSSIENQSEDKGHDELISIIETKVKAKSPKDVNLQNALERFLSHIKEESSLHRS